MKNIFKILLAVVSLAFFACDPLDDTYKELGIEGNGEEGGELVFVKDVVYELTSDDYDIADEVCDCSRYGNFSSEEDAKIGIPAVLSEVYPALGMTSSALVTYDMYNGSAPDLRGDQEIYTVTSEEYTELGFSYPNFGNLATDVPKYAEYKFPDAWDGDYMDVTHDLYVAGSFYADTTSRAGYTVAYGWMYVDIIPDAAYGDYFGESGIDFSYEDEGVEKIPVYLKDNIKFSAAGDRKLVQFNYDNGDDVDPTTPALALYIYDGMDWLLYDDAYQITKATLAFGNNGTVWVPDNTIKYTLSRSDFNVIGTNTAGTNPAGSTSVLTYGNFDLALWPKAQIVDAINQFMMDSGTFIKEVDQKYLITYATYNPSGASDILLIYDGSAYVEVE